MSSIDIEGNFFTCREKDDFAVLTILKGAKGIITTIDAKEEMIQAIESIKRAGQIKGLATIYSSEFISNEEYVRYLKESYEDKTYADKGRHATIYKHALLQFIELIREFPMPIICGMSGEVGPESLGLSLAFDLRIAAEDTVFGNPNLQLGFPPSVILSFYLSKILGPSKATEMLLTKPEMTAEEALALGLITKITSRDRLEQDCLDGLRALQNIPPNTLTATRAILQPSVDETRKYLDAGFKRAMTAVHKMKA